jgi:thiamine biosynthesis lipoprotein
MGTLVRVVVYTPDEHSARRAFRAAFDRIAALDHTLSDYRPDSELKQLASQAAGQAVPVSPDLFAVLHAAQDLAQVTGGAFDVTQGPVIQLWRDARRTGRSPDQPALQEAAGRSGFGKVILDQAQHTVTLAVSGMALDVGGIGKGYAASEALEVVAALGVRSALVAVSGDLAFSDAPPGQRGWRVSIHSGDPSEAPVAQALELTHAAVSTSGNSAQHVDIDGRRYSHIINPAAGHGLLDDLTVAIIASHGLEADGLATAVSVLGPDRGLALVESRPGTEALITRRTSEGTTVLTSTGFRDLSARLRAPSPQPVR